MRLIERLNEHEAAQRLAIPVEEVIELIRNGELDAVQVNGRWSISVKDIERFLERRGASSRQYRDQDAYRSFGFAKFLLTLMEIISWLAIVGGVLAALGSNIRIGILWVIAGAGSLLSAQVFSAVFAIHGLLKEMAFELKQIKTAKSPD